jgi:hypothetical protein
VTDLLVQAESRGLSAFLSLHLDLVSADSECARDPSLQTSRPQEPARGRAGKSASSAPLIMLGRYGAAPRSKG